MIIWKTLIGIEVKSKVSLFGNLTRSVCTFCSSHSIDISRIIPLFFLSNKIHAYVLFLALVVNPFVSQQKFHTLILRKIIFIVRSLRRLLRSFSISYVTMPLHLAL